MSHHAFNEVSVIKKANVYFEGACVSHSLVMSDGSKKSVGVILPTEHPLTFKTGVAERMEIVSGSCSVQLEQEGQFEHYNEGESFVVAANSQFMIQCVSPVHYVCHFDG